MIEFVDYGEDLIICQKFQIFTTSGITLRGIGLALYDAAYKSPQSFFNLTNEPYAKILASKNITRLGLTENSSLVGIITARDIVDAYQMEIS
jgi:CBS domain-containing protein